MKSDQVDMLAVAVFRNLEQVDQTVEAGLTREPRGDIRKPNGLNGIDFNLAFVHRITAAHPDARTHPDANAAGDIAAPHALAKTCREDHRGILQRVQQRHRFAAPAKSVAGRQHHGAQFRMRATNWEFSHRALVFWLQATGWSASPP